MATMNITASALLGKTVTLTKISDLGYFYESFLTFKGRVTSVVYSEQSQEICIAEHGFFDLKTIEITEII